MIVLSSPPPKKLSRYFSVIVAILAALGIVFTGVVAFTQLPDAWQDPDRAALFSVLFQILMGLVGMFAAVWQITQQLTVGDPRQCLAATQETLAIKTVNKPILFLKRRDCIALAMDGKALVMADGKSYIIHAYGAKADSVEALIDSLYNLWWPGLTRAEVREYLTAIKPPRSKWLALPLFSFIFPIMFIPTFHMWESIWIPTTLFTITVICFTLLTVRIILKRAREEGIRFPLVESDEAAYNEE